MRIPFFVRWQQQTAQQATIYSSLSCITRIINPELQFLRRTKPRLFSKPFSKPVGSKRLTHNKSRLKWIARFLQIRRFLVDKSFLRGEEENSRRSCSPSGGRSNFLDFLVLFHQGKSTCRNTTMEVVFRLMLQRQHANKKTTSNKLIFNY
jgi:hypothetical protein